MDDRPIGMFDSGVGGLTVYKEIKKAMPNEKIIYLGDTKNFPYGSKSKQSIIELCKKNIDFLLKQNVKIIVIACGTATSQALEEVRRIYKVPIIGIIQPTIEYIKSKENLRTIGVIATRGTIRSNSWKINLKKQIKDVNVYNKECPLLAPMAEEGWIDNEIAKLTIQEYIKDFPKLDALILGCTHYPLFKKIIKEQMPDTEIINTGEQIAKYIRKNMNRIEEIVSNVDEKDIENIKENNKTITNSKMQDEIYLTDTECNFVNVSYKLLNEKIELKKADI